MRLLILLLLVGCACCAEQSAIKESYDSDDCQGLGENPGGLMGCPIIGASMGAIGIGFLCCILMLAGIPVFMIGRGCCNCFGGRRQLPGFCCGSEDKLKVTESLKTYSRREIMATKGLMGAGAGLAVLGLIVGFLGLGSFNKGVDNSFGAVHEVLDLARDTAGSVRNALTIMDDTFTALKERSGLANDADIQALSVEMPNDLEALEVEIDQIKADVDSVKDNEVALMQYITSTGGMVLLVVPVLCMLVACLTGFFNIRRVLPYFCCCGIALIGALCWFLYVLVVIFHITFASVCEDVSFHLDGKPSFLSDQLPTCDDALFDDFSSAVNTFEAEAAKTLCDVLDKQLCQWEGPDPNNPLGPDVRYLDCSTMPAECKTFEHVGELPDTVLMDAPLRPHHAAIGACPTTGTPDGQSWCPLRQCSQDDATGCGECEGAYATDDSKCFGKALKDYTWAIVELADVASRAKTEVLDSIVPLLNCGVLYDRILGPFEEPCHTLAGGLGMLRTGLMLLGLGCFVSIIGVILGMKRFIKLPPPANGGDEEEGRRPSQVHPAPKHLDDDEYPPTPEKKPEDMEPTI